MCVCAACSSISIASYWLNLALEQLPARFGFSHASPQPPYSARGMNFSKSQHTHIQTHSESERRPMRPGSYLPICSLKCRTMREITMQPKTKQRNMNHFLIASSSRQGRGETERGREGWHHRLHIRNAKVERETRNHNVNYVTPLPKKKIYFTFYFHFSPINSIFVVWENCLEFAE